MAAFSYRVSSHCAPWDNIQLIGRFFKVESTKNGCAGCGGCGLKWSEVSCVVR